MIAGSTVANIQAVSQHSRRYASPKCAWPHSTSLSTNLVYHSDDFRHHRPPPQTLPTSFDTTTLHAYSGPPSPLCASPCWWPTSLRLLISCERDGRGRLQPSSLLVTATTIPSFIIDVSPPPSPRTSVSRIFVHLTHISTSTEQRRRTCSAPQQHTRRKQAAMETVCAGSIDASCCKELALESIA